MGEWCEQFLFHQSQCCLGLNSRHCIIYKQVELLLVLVLLSGFFLGSRHILHWQNPTLLNSDLIWNWWKKSLSVGHVTDKLFLFLFLAQEKTKKSCIMVYINSLFRLLQMQERSLLYSHVTWQSMLLQRQKCKSISKSLHVCIVDLWCYICRLLSSMHA